MHRSRFTLAAVSRATLVLSVGVTVCGAVLLYRDFEDAGRPFGTPEAAGVIHCARRTISGARYRVCELPPHALGRLELVARDPQGEPVRTIQRLHALLRARGETLLFATNAGLFHRPDSTTGMLVAQGRLHARLDTSAGPADPCAVANFYCPPNGVFLVSDSGAAVLPTRDFAARQGSFGRIRLATQSGPLLVRGGALARPFDAASRSGKVRNGVGIRADGTVVFAIADDEVSFHHFASAFRGALRCPDALFLDGAISQLFTGPGSALPPADQEFAALFAVTAADPSP